MIPKKNSNCSLHLLLSLFLENFSGAVNPTLTIGYKKWCILAPAKLKPQQDSGFDLSIQGKRIPNVRFTCHYLQLAEKDY